MFKNNLKTAWRHLRKQKIFSLINVISLVVGITGACLILLYIQDEMSYDRFQQKRENVVRITSWFHPDSSTFTHFARCHDAWKPWVDALHDEYPEIRHIARLSRREGTTIQLGSNLFSERFFFITDQEVFKVFTIPLIAGDPSTALENPHSVIITESMSEKYLAGNALGKILNVIDGQGNKTPYTVTAVMKDWPDNSHIQINFLASNTEQERMNDWAYTYLLLDKHADYQQLDYKLPDFVQKQFGDQAASNSGFHLQKLTDIHLHSHLDRELKINGDIAIIYVLWAVALLIIIIACINYINLTTAQSLKRGKEVGIKKTVGSTRGHLILQFLTESLLVCLIAAVLSLVLIYFFLPVLNSLTGKAIKLASLWQGSLLIQLSGMALLIALLSCVYPAVLLSGFRPLETLNNKALSAGNASRRSVFRNTLVTAQFVIASILLACTFVFRQQLQYLNNKPLGLNKEQVISIGKDIPISARSQYQRLKKRLSGQSNVVNVSACMQEPFYEIKDVGYCYVESRYEGNDKAYLYILPVDENFLNVLGIKLLAGKSFPEHSLYYGTGAFTNNADVVKEINETRRFYIINEMAMRYIGWKSADEAIGKQMDWANAVLHLQKGPIIGVVKDFHISTLQKQIKPFVLVYEPYFFGSILVKLKPQNIHQSILQIKEIWQAMFPEYPFEFHFLDDLYANLYTTERQFNTITTWFTMMAIFIGCLGLIGLVLFTTEQRTKEVGIRKVLGASVPRILTMITSDFLKWVLLANFIGWPVAWYVMYKWLENFAYRIDLTFWPFLITGISALLIALLTISIQAVRAATANPIESLRYE